MTKINVIDFDKTLIPLDSFRLYVLTGIKRFRFTFILFTLLRLLRIINTNLYKKLISIAAIKGMDNKDLSDFCENLITKIDKTILNDINSKTDINTINIICSASPDFYISLVADKLGWHGYGSYFNDNGCFVNLYGANKKDLILKVYPKSEYAYNYAISDSETDMPLLKEFNDYILIKHS